jgi:hypothetical protein
MQDLGDRSRVAPSGGCKQCAHQDVMLLLLCPLWRWRGRLPLHLPGLLLRLRLLVRPGWRLRRSGSHCR